MVPSLRSICIMLLYSFFWTSSTSTSRENCTDVFTLQPPTDLNCNPLNTVIQLYCRVKVTNPNDMTIQWFRSTTGCMNKLNISEDEYMYEINNHTTDDNSTLFDTSITINVTDDTTGFYWCEVNISNSSAITDATRVYQFNNDCSCKNETIYAMHNRTEQCLYRTRPPPVCSPKPSFTPAVIIVPLVLAFTTLAVLWIGLIVHARYLGALRNVVATTSSSQPFNRCYNKHALAEQDNDIENDCYVDSKKSMLETEKQINLNEISDNKQPSRPAAPAEYLKPVKTTDTKPTELQDSTTGKSCSYEDGMIKSTDTTIHVHVYGNTKDI